MTSLANQLQRLAVTPVSQLQYALHSDKKKTSLLFDPKEAANLDRETIFNIGINGLEELELIDENFAEFEKNLFHESAQNFERSIQTKDVNEKLDANIAAFLTRLSPYFLLKPAHKTLEWLIHRFHIHLHNVDDLMRCILPYHETNMFVRVVQLLRLNTPQNRWTWLEPLQKPGLPLDRKSVINHCCKDLGFLSFICDMIPKALKVFPDGIPESRFRVLFSFYASTVVETLTFADRISNEMIAQLIPFIVKGLQSNLNSYLSATYMIIAQLMTKAALDDKVVSSLISNICETMPAKLYEEAVVCLALITQHQENVHFSLEALTCLCENPELALQIQLLSDQYELQAFVNLLCDDIISMALKLLTKGEKSKRKQNLPQAEAFLNILTQILRTVALEKSQAAVITRTVFRKCCLVCLKYKPSKMKRFGIRIEKVMKTLEKRYPDALDATTESILAEDKSEMMREAVQNIINLSLETSKHQLLEGGNGTLVLSLQHPNPHVRCLALQQLTKSWNEQQIKDEQFVIDALLARLSDDCTSVVQTVLDHQDIFHILPSAEVFAIIKSILQREKEMWSKVQTEAIKFLSSGKLMLDDLDTLAVTILPCLFVTDSKRKMAKTVFKSSFLSQHALFTNIKEGKWGQVMSSKTEKIEWATVGQLNLEFIKCISNNLVNMSKAERWNLISLMVTSAKSDMDQQSCNVFLLLCLLSHVLSSLLAPAEEILHISEIIIDLVKLSLSKNSLLPSVKQTEVADESEFSITAEYIARSSQTLQSKNRFSIIFIKCCLATVIKTVKIPSVFKEKAWWQTAMEGSLESKRFFIFFVSLFDLLTSEANEKPHTKHFRHLTDLFFKTHFSEKAELLSFLASVWTSTDPYDDVGKPDQVTFVVQIRAIRIAQAAIEMSKSKDLVELMSTSSYVLLSLLVALASHLRQMRECTLNCLQCLYNKCHDSSYGYSTVVGILCDRKDELIHDYNYLPQLYGSIFMDDSLSCVKKVKRSTKALLLKSFSGLTNCTVSDVTSDYVQERLLWCFSKVNTVAFVENLLPVLDRYLTIAESSSPVQSRHRCRTVQHILTKFNKETVSIFEKNPESFKLFVRALKANSISHSDMPTFQSLTFNQLTKSTFHAISSSDAQQMILSTIFDLVVNLGDANVAELAEKTAKSLPLNAKQIVNEIDKLIQLFSSSGNSIREVRRKSVGRRSTPLKSGSIAVHSEVRNSGFAAENDADNLESEPWRRVIIILEMTQRKKKIADIHLLIPCFFTLLSKCLEMESTCTSEYVKQLILSCINHACVRLSKSPDDVSKMSANQFNVELIVNCIRLSSNPQTHQHALTLLTVAANMFPDHVLHNIVSIFTFMGTSVLRQDDSYSFQVTVNTVQTVIPAMIKESRSHKNRDVSNFIVSVTRVFVDAFPDIPGHRRLPLFSTLLKTINVEEHLWEVLLLLFELYVTKTSSEIPEWHDKTSLHPDVEFCLDLCGQFQPTVQLTALQMILSHLQELPEEKPTEKERTKEPLTPRRKRLKVNHHGRSHSSHAARQLFQIEKHTAKQFRHFKFVAVTFTSTLLSSSGFVEQVAELDESAVESLTPLYHQLLEQSLAFICQISRSSEMHSQQPTARYWKILLHKVHEILDKVNMLLRNPVFLSVIMKLLENEMMSIRRKALEILNHRLAAHEHELSFTESEVPALLEMLPILMDIIQKPSTSQDSAIYKQTALITIKLLCKQFCVGHPNDFQEVLKAVTVVVVMPDLHDAVLASTFLCLAELCADLKMDCVTSLSLFMPRLLEVLADTSALKRNDLLLTCSVTCLHKVVESLPGFISPYVAEICTRVSVLSHGFGDASIHKGHLSLRLKSLKHNLASNTPPRVLLPAISKSYQDLNDNSEEESIVHLMSVLTNAIREMSKEDLTNFYQQLMNIFLTALDFRSQQIEGGNHSITSEIESSVIDAIVAMVIKLSEQTFRPMFYKFYDWATRTDVPKARTISFYRLADRIAEKLKGLFALFAGHLVQSAANLLDKNNRSKSDELWFTAEDAADEKTRLLLTFIINCLHKLFLYDSQGFLNRERFETLIQSLVDQLENVSGKEDDYNLEEYLVPCLAQFAVAAGDDSLWKSLNYQILLKTRHSNSLVRLMALSVVSELTARLSDEYMNLLPETLPFLAELMEDESPEVEQKTQTVLQQMEKILGEPLQKYF